MQISHKYNEEIFNEVKDLSDEQIASLMKIIHIFKESIIRQRELDFRLQKEFEEWDRLSDEALLNFEDTL
ncbi:MAG: hypothetical protein MIO93_07790 [ANME-2 cluster archaeon]|jgi:hypothetical protein|nr:hypothetical protein [ANME-2 cluster archaeon]